MRIPSGSGSGASGYRTALYLGLELESPPFPRPARFFPALLLGRPGLRHPTLAVCLPVPPSVPPSYATAPSRRPEQRQEGSTRDLLGARVITTAFINGSPQTAIEVVAGVAR